GKGRLSLEFCGYDICHNPEKVIEEKNYNPEADIENTPDSVFCAHGAGFNVKWQDVPEYMHIGYSLKKDSIETPVVNKRNFHIDDKELEAIMKHEFGEVKYELFRKPTKKTETDKTADIQTERKKWLIVDGYNVIFAWDELKEIAETDLSSAREALMHILSNYSAFTNINIVLVFDAYKVPGNQGEKFDFNNIHVVYTKERELADVYIEKLVSQIGKNEQVTIVTSDALIQLSAVRFGVLRKSADEFGIDIDIANRKISELIEKIHNQTPKSTISDVADN
ncbi:MAG: NYN domain-containing protein, partial [Clostridia bacterium]|nr:NYN domain-containing protein [Clostridia bacterium]